ARPPGRSAAAAGASAHGLEVVVAAGGAGPGVALGHPLEDGPGPVLLHPHRHQPGLDVLQAAARLQLVVHAGQHALALGRGLHVEDPLLEGPPARAALDLALGAADGEEGDEVEREDVADLLEGVTLL